MAATKRAAGMRFHRIVPRLVCSGTSPERRWHPDYKHDEVGLIPCRVASNGVRTTYTYDGASQTSKIEHWKDTATYLGRLTYTYDKVGNRTQLMELDGSTTTWTYDAAYRLTNEYRTGTSGHNTTHTYDPVGNRLIEVADGQRATFTYDASNQVTQHQFGASSLPFTYDGAGNLITYDGGTAPTTRQYTWDNDNRLAVVQPYGGNPTTMTYNADGQRLRLITAGGTSGYLWDMQNMVLETLAGSPVAQSTYKPDLYGDLLIHTVGSTPSFPLFDALGSTLGLANLAKTLTDTYLYKAYGAPLPGTGSTANPFRWVGRYGYQFDNQLSANFVQYYVRASVYDPVSARWLSADPLGVAVGQWNLGLYVDSNPLFAIDPSGLWIGVGDNTWVATSDSDSFEHLLSFNAPGLNAAKNKSCIRPIPGKDQAINRQMEINWRWKRPAKCGVYETKNLHDQLPSGGNIVAAIGSDSNGYIRLAGAFYGARPMLGPELAKQMKAQSQDGNTPLSAITVVGHSWRRESVIGGVNPDRTFNLGQVFKLQDILDTGPFITPFDWPKWTDAIQGIRPPLCWLRTTSTVRLVGCYTSEFAKQWAQAMVRKPSVVFGTNLPTWAYDDRTMGWGKKSTILTSGLRILRRVRLTRRKNIKIHDLGFPMMQQISHSLTDGSNGRADLSFRAIAAIALVCLSCANPMAIAATDLFLSHGDRLSSSQLEHVTSITLIRDIRPADPDGAGSNTNDDSDMEQLARALRLKSLSVAYSKVTNSGFASLRHLACLEAIDANDTRIDDGALRYLKQSAGLKVLLLGGTKISNAGVRYIVEQFPGIKTLQVSDTQLDDESVPLLIKLRQLSQLDISHTRITDKSIPELSQMKNLEFLNVSRSSTDDDTISKDGAQRLRQALPNSKIFHD